MPAVGSARDFALNPIAEREIGEADNALGHLYRAVTATCAHRGDAGDELSPTGRISTGPLARYIELLFDRRMVRS